MATNRVTTGKGRIMIPVFAATHKAGDLVYENGYYGIMEEDVVAGARGYICHDEVWLIKNLVAAAATASMGVKLAAPATSQATTLPVGLFGAHPSFQGNLVTVGWNAFGRVWATGNASVVKTQLFNPNQY